MRRLVVVVVLSLLALGLVLGPALSRGLGDSSDAPAPIELRPGAGTKERPQRAAKATKPRRQTQKPTGKVRPHTEAQRPAGAQEDAKPILSGQRESQAPPPAASQATPPSPPSLQPPVPSHRDDDEDNGEGDDDGGSEGPGDED